MDMKSLASLASATLKPDRGDPSQKDARTAKTSGRGGNFGGLLKSFMTGDDSVSKAGKQAGPSLSGSKSAGAAGKSDASPPKEPGGAAAGASASGAAEKAENKELSRHSREARKTAEEELAEAALEAADLIWSLLYPDSTSMNYLVDGPPETLALSILSNRLGIADPGAPLSGMGAGELGPDAMRAALETANVSAEMNNAAVKSAIEELLDGMPRSAVESALSAKAAEQGIPEPEGGFLRMAEELGLTEMSYKEAGGDERAGALLAQLEKAAGETIRQNSIAETAEFSESDWSETDMRELVARFLKENPKGNASPLSSPAEAEQLFQSFANWLGANAAQAETKVGIDDKIALARIVQQIAAAAGQADGAAEADNGAGVFSASKTNLESALLSNESKKVASAFLAAMTALSGEDGENALQAQTGDNAKADSKSMIADSALTAMNAGRVDGGTGQKTQGGSGSMLEQIENIEKLGEVLRMRNSGGVKNLTLQLSPPELGKVSIRVEARDGVVSALLRVEKPEAAAQLANNLQHLRETLKAQGIELGELEVRQQPDGQTGHDGGGGHKRQPESAGGGDASGAMRHDPGDGEEAKDAAQPQERMEGAPLNVYA